VLSEDLSQGAELVRIPAINESSVNVPLPLLTYRREYCLSPKAAAYVSEMYSRNLVQWAGTKFTGTPPGHEMPNFVTEKSVLYNQNTGMLERIQFTPCMEDSVGGRPELIKYAFRPRACSSIGLVSALLKSRWRALS
jgi:hypothetical protein